ncbi:hypothetical protein [Undibacterium sp. JH2W]|uniref:hypothetical protein n=1 Tax=Undibacterium sp. JH2W TaxID=3413037 RepID=UPI003BF5AD1D
MNIQAKKTEAEAGVIGMKIARVLTEQEILLVSGGDDSNGGQNHDPSAGEEPPPGHVPYPWELPIS